MAAGIWHRGGQCRLIHGIGQVNGGWNMAQCICRVQWSLRRNTSQSRPPLGHYGIRSDFTEFYNFFNNIVAFLLS